MRVVIVGAGMAGAATAWSLARRGGAEIVVLEQERDAGAHSTSRNASILRTAIPDPVLHRLACESAAFLRHPPEGFSRVPLVDPVGLFLTAPAGAAESLRAWAGREDCASTAREVAPEELYRRIPALTRELEAVFVSEDEGVMDVHAILQGFLEGARRGGAEIRLGTAARRLLLSDGAVTGVETDAGHVPADVVVLATGAWGGRLAEAAGLPLPMTPRRRHLLCTVPEQFVHDSWPVVWIAGDEFYFRPESGGLLLCACDTDPVTPEEGEVPDADVAEAIARKTARWLPSLGDVGAANFWAGMRTFAADNRFVLGLDPRARGLAWAAALGGHGITCSPAVGSLVADQVLEGGSHHPAAAALAPDRLLGRPSAAVSR